MGHNGMCLAHHGEMVVWVSFGIPGETVVAEVADRHAHHIEARTVEVLAAAPDRVTPPCPYYGACGGCQYQHIAYDRQLELKQQVVAGQLRRIGHFKDPPVRLPLPSPEQWGYRNHARFTVGRFGDTGFVQRGTHRLIPIDECRLMHPWINQTIAELRGQVAETRALNLRFGINTGDYLIQPKLKNEAVSIPTGQPSYREKLLGRPFTVASPSFFQVNTHQAERMIELVRGYLRAAKTDLLIDAYAGVGTFSVLLAESVGRVIGLEESASSVRDARANGEGIANLEFREGKVEDVLPGLGLQPDVVLLDPPRAGCHPTVIQTLIDHPPRQLLYVSCDPATLARDLRLLVDGGFTLDLVQPVDLFPQTYHIECVSVLRWSGVPAISMTPTGLS
ncbi:MAG: class I SAM-dependent RNA methyltransferase [Dehalococcoidia bacterium]|nr:class I SAM-dependent RNA methyltransferase [Dehalococcoidia bacterium]